jgi:hypothetical protein
VFLGCKKVLAVDKSPLHSSSEYVTRILKGIMPRHLMTDEADGGLFVADSYVKADS